MKKQIKEVQDYFKSKMLSSDFVITAVDEFILELIIDNEYKFFIWIGNLDIPKSRKPAQYKLNFMDIGLTDDEAIKLNDILLPAINKFRKETLLEQKRKEFERLQNELSRLS